MTDPDLTDPLSLVGTTIADKYAIESVVGQGGFAIVYRAMHLLWKVPVAVKVFSALGAVSPSQRQQLLDDFLQEGRLLTQLSGRTAAILQARDVAMLSTANGESVPYMVLEWLEGRSLESVIEEDRRGGAPPRSLEDAIRLLDPIAEALAIAHEQGIVHRDLKPANIFVMGNPRAPSAVKLLDFGIAKVVQDAQKMGFTKTAGHVTSFTPYYGAPEQFDRNFGATSPATDVFAFALVLAELVSGREPMMGDSIVQLAYQSCDPAKRPSPRALGVNVRDDVEAIFLRALAVNPQERFATAGAFWSALKMTLSGQTWAPGDRGSAPGSGSGPYAPASNPRPDDGARISLAQTAVAPSGHTPIIAAPPSRGPLFAMIAVGGVLLVGGVVAAVALTKKPNTPTPVPSTSVAPSASVAVPAPKRECPKGMQLVPGGKFFMGSDTMSKTEYSDPRPAHQVTLSPYCIDRFEVTVAQYKACSDPGECKAAPRDNWFPGITAKQKAAYDPVCNILDPEKRAQHPMNCIDWQLANDFCVHEGKRLPTEAEWEFATRGSDGRKYPWGYDDPTGGHLNACGKECEAWGKAHKQEDVTRMYDADDGYANTAPVGKFPAGASPFGLEDVVGNVWEWTADWYGKYEAAPVTDPKGPATGTERTARGGAWNGNDPTWLYPTHRYMLDPAAHTHGVGFRCAKPLDSK